MSKLDNLKKYRDYIFDKSQFDVEVEYDKISQHALDTYRTLRGKDRPRSIVIHGIMKRSGTVYVGQLISLHPDISSYPNQIWEVPFLPLTGDIVELQDKFALAYQQNLERIGCNDFLPMFGGAFIHYLYSFIPEGKRMLIKMPGVQYLNNFYNVFPDEDLLVLVRDGRDVVTSTIRTWPQIQFSLACRKWDRSAKMVLSCDQAYAEKPGYLLAKYEDAVRQPEEFMAAVLSRFELPSQAYPYEEIESLKVIGSSTTIRSGETWVKKTKDFKPIGRWQQWSGWKKAIFKLIAGESLVKLEYCQDLNW